MTDADLLETLRDCYAPSYVPSSVPGERPGHRNIVEAGLVRSATLTRDNDAPGANIPGVPPRYIASVSITAPGSDEAANAQLAAQIENRLLGLEAISRAEITLLPPLFAIL